MSIEQRIERLEFARSEELKTKEYVLKFNWEDSSGDTETLAEQHDKTIEMYDRLIAALKARL